MEDMSLGVNDPPGIEDMSLEHEDSLLGIEDSKGKLIVSLLGEKEFSLICICGMAGMGKTTLARSVYEDVSVRRDFHCRAWVSVGQWFCTRRVLEDILISITCHKRDEMELSTDLDLAEMMYSVLEHERFLIILDDVWDTDVWDCLSICFPTAEATGSRVVITTRSSEVERKVENMAHGIVHEVRGLSEQESLDLLFVSAHRQKPDPVKDSELIEVAKNTVKICSGIPLLVKLVGGILISKPSPVEWEMVCKNIVLSQKVDQDYYDCIKGILNLSYGALPDYLKPCFLYFATFLDGEEVKGYRLLRLWVAEGFIVHKLNHVSEKMSMVDVAESYLYELQARSLVMVGKEKVSRSKRLKSYCIHDLLRDFCSLKVKENSVLLDTRPGIPCSSPITPSPTHKINRLALYFRDGSSPIPSKWKMTKNLDLLSVTSVVQDKEQSIQFHISPDLEDVSRIEGLYLRSWNCKRVPSHKSLHSMTLTESLVKLFGRIDLKSLRLLDCVSINLDMMRLSLYIEKMTRLRHLNLESCNLESLPSSISCLLNLQTLILPDTRKRMVLPSEIQYLIALRFLFLPRFFEVRGGAKLHIHRLVDLEELVNFVSEACEVKDLWKLTKLRRLDASLNGIIEDIAEMNRIVETSCFILSLCIRLSDDYSVVNCPVIEDLWKWPNLQVLRLEGIMRTLPMLVSHSLQVLSFNGSELDEDPMEILEKLPNLWSLELCNNATMGRGMTCSASGMPQLISLTLSNLENLEEFIIEEGGMPKLSTLALERCNRLNPPQGLIWLTSLLEVKVLSMPQAFMDSLNKLRRTGHEWSTYVIKTNQLF